MKEESPMNPEQQLELITQMLAESRKTFVSMGFSSMIWGAFVCVGTALSYIFGSLGWYTAIGVLWAVLMIGAFLVVGWHGRREVRRQHKTTSLNKIFNEIWVFVFAVIVLYQMVSLLQPQRITLSFVLCVVSILVGTAYWISSSMTQYPIVRVVSVVWIASSIVVLLVPPFWAPAAVGICTFLCEFVPGIYLYARERKESL